MEDDFMVTHIAEAVYDCYLLAGIEDTNFILLDLRCFYPTVTSDVLEEAIAIALEWEDIANLATASRSAAL